MARYVIDRPFTYTAKSGHLRLAAHEGQPWLYTVWDTTDPAWDVPDNWAPPLLEVLPMDLEAKAALDAARAPYAGTYLLGVGFIPLDEPIWTPPRWWITNFVTHPYRSRQLTVQH